MERHLLPRVRHHVELLPREHVEAEDGRGGVADGEARAVCRDPVEARNAHARGGPVHGEEDVVRLGDAQDAPDLAPGPRTQHGMFFVGGAGRCG